MGDLSKNFSEKEFYSPRDKGTTWKDRKGNIIKERPLPSKELLLLLETIRTAVDKPMNIESGVRSIEYNASLSGSASSSAHLAGDAADIWVNGMSNKELGELIKKLDGCGALFYLAYCYLIKGSSNTRVHVGVDQYVKRKSKWGPWA